MTDKNVQILDLQNNKLFPATKASIVKNNSGENLGDVEAGAQVNKIEKIKVNGVELSVVTKEVNIELPDTYTKTESDGKYATKDEVSAIPKFAVKVVDSLPETGEDATVYLVRTGSASKNLYTEYIYVDNKFEELGTQKIDISGKQDQLTEAQLAAVNSGITEALVTKFNGYDTAKANKATTLSGYGITDAYTKTEADGKFLTEHQDISNLAPKATTLDGYGITNAYTKTEIETKFAALNYITYQELV